MWDEIMTKVCELKSEAVISIELKTICGGSHLGLDTSNVWDGDAADLRMRKRATKSNGEMDWAEYGKGFVYCDASNRDRLGGYKLPFADVKDGQLKAVWGGVHAAYAACMGARTPIDLSESDKSSCINFLKSYYRRFDKPIPGEENSI